MYPSPLRCWSPYAVVFSDSWCATAAVIYLVFVLLITSNFHSQITTWRTPANNTTMPTKHRTLRRTVCRCHNTQDTTPPRTILSADFIDDRESANAYIHTMVPGTSMEKSPRYIRCILLITSFFRWCVPSWCWRKPARRNAPVCVCFTITLL